MGASAIVVCLATSSTEVGVEVLRKAFLDDRLVAERAEGEGIGVRSDSGVVGRLGVFSVDGGLNNLRRLVVACSKAFIAYRKDNRLVAHLDGKLSLSKLTKRDRCL